MTVKHFMDGGYTVIKEADYLLAFDHGDLGYLSIAAHGHADALAIWLHINGQPVIIDAGTYTYNGERKWRDYFRSTTAHNTLCINGESSSIMTGAFNWGEKARCEVLSYDDGDCWHIEASHDGYVKRFGATHSRRIEAVGDGVKIIDKLSGLLSAEADDVAISFLIHPDLDVVRDGSECIISKDNTEILRMENTAKCRIICGDEEPIGGWYSPSFGKKIPATQVVFYGDMEFETVLRIV